MKFRINGVVWDPSKGKALARGPIFETEDQGVIDRLKELGFQEIGEKEAPPKLENAKPENVKIDIVPPRKGRPPKK